MSTVRDQTSGETSSAHMKPFRDYGSVDEGCAELGRILNLDFPVERDVFLGAASDANYRRNLLVSRHTSAFRDALLANPPEIGGAGTPSNTELLHKAAASFWKWAKSGLATVPDDVFETRMAACLGCPNLGDPPKARLLYSLAAGSKICTLCGCVVSKKARLASETCPDKSPNAPELTRWNEPV